MVVNLFHPLFVNCQLKKLKKLRNRLHVPKIEM